MLILGIDQSLTATGVAVIDFKNGKSRVQSTETIKTKETGSPRLIEIRKKIATYLEDSMIKCVVRENYAFAAVGRATFSSGELGGVLNVLIHEKGFIEGKNYHIIHNTSWKKFLLGQGNLKKDTNYLMEIYKKLGIQFKSDAESDAYCLAMMGGFIHSIKTNEMKFSDLTDVQQTCLFDVDKLKEKGTTQVKALKLSEDEKRSLMLF